MSSSRIVLLARFLDLQSTDQDTPGAIDLGWGVPGTDQNTQPHVAIGPVAVHYSANTSAKQSLVQRSDIHTCWPERLSRKKASACRDAGFCKPHPEA